MDSIRTAKLKALVVLLVMALTACSVSYKFNGASINYNETKTIQIADFPIRSSYVWGPMASIFNNQLKDTYANHTRLIQVKRNGDLKVEGEITQYSQRNKSVNSEGVSAQTELSMTVNVRFTNNRTLNGSLLPHKAMNRPVRSIPYRKNLSLRWSRI